MFSERFKGAHFLNSGRNCLGCIIEHLEIKEIHIPFYICSVVWQTLRGKNVKINFYHIDTNFLPTKNFGKNDFVLYPDYFGICSKQSDFLAKKYKNLISDNALSFFAKPKGAATFYSPRKFFNVNDGGILLLDNFNSEDFETAKDRNFEIKDYDSFCQNELFIDKDSVKKMSEQTFYALKNIDFEAEKTKRQKLFKKFTTLLNGINDLNIDISNADVPYKYPLLSPKNSNLANFLDKNGIYLIKYGSKLPEDFPEHDISNNLALLPLNEKTLELTEQFFSK